MLLAIDIGNTSATFGLFFKEELRKTWSVPTIELPSYLAAKQFNQKLDKVLVSSVVPSQDKFIKKKFRQAEFISAENIPVIKIKLGNKKEIGADRVVNVLAAQALYGGPAIIVDFGTATTFDVLSDNSEYLGGAIAPGLGLARDILHEKTAKLPLVEIMEPQELIGKNTKEAILSGLIFGYASLVEGMIDKFKEKLGRKIKVIATGGFAPLINKHTGSIDIIDENLTLQGLRLAGTML